MFSCSDTSLVYFVKHVTYTTIHGPYVVWLWSKTLITL